jgi:RNA polymerase sigma-70 factor, ECF subfamily
MVVRLRTMAQGQGTSPTLENSDSALMARILAQDAEGLRLLYERHAPVLLALCLRIVGDRTEAEQILLDVFWETWNRAQRYDAGRSAPLTYLTLLARSRALDARRRLKSSAVVELRFDSDATGNTARHARGQSLGSAPINDLLAVERAQSVREALLSLEADERSLIEACFYDGYTHVQLATKLRQPLGTVKTRIRRGLARLRIRLRHVCDEPILPPSETAEESEVQ